MLNSGDKPIDFDVDVDMVSIFKCVLVFSVFVFGEVLNSSKA